MTDYHQYVGQDLIIVQELLENEVSDISTKLESLEIEILLNDGNPVYQSVFLTKEKEVAFRDYDINQEILSYGEYDGLYWRFIPDPPEDKSYDVG